MTARRILLRSAAVGSGCSISSSLRAACEDSEDSDDIAGSALLEEIEGERGDEEGDGGGEGEDGDDDDDDDDDDDEDEEEEDDEGEADAERWESGGRTPRGP